MGNFEIVYREWNSKIFATPKVPRGKNGMIDTIDLILNAVKNKNSMSENLKIEDTTANSNLEYLCIQLRPIGLVKHNYGVWELTAEAEEYLKRKDKLFLAEIFCANVKFFAEMINILNEEKTSKELYDIAINNYRLGWKTKSDINSRLTWLKEFELIGWNDYKLTYKLNEKGLNFLTKIKFIKPEELCFGLDKTTQIEDIEITSFGEKILENLKEKLDKRKESIGYIPGNISEFKNTISEYIQLMYNCVDVKDVYDFSEKTYNISKSSTGAFISTLVNMDFIDHKSRSIVQSSKNALNWNENKSSIDLLCWLHSKFLFFFEILQELENNSLSNKELTSIAKRYYGFSIENIDEIRKRIKMLITNDLIMEDSVNTYTITNKGKLLLNKVIIQKRNTSRQIDDVEELIKKNDIEELINEFRIASRDSANPNRFEKVLRDVFEFLGFEAILLGGSGKTDVLLKTHTTKKFSYVVAIDAKSTASGNVTENLIDFDTIKEHKQKHSADYNVIIGANFQGERLIERAKEHKVLLLDIDKLETIIRESKEIPLNFDSYKKLFEQNGIANIDVLDEDKEKVRKQGILMQAIMDCLIEESDDEFTEGILTERDIYRSLRNLEKLKNVTPSEIQQMLEFLSSPLIGCISRSKDGYFAIESLNNISKKFEYYSNACK